MEFTSIIAGGKIAMKDCKVDNGRLGTYQKATGCKVSQNNTSRRISE